MKARFVALLGFVLALGLLAPIAGSHIAVAAQIPVDCRNLDTYIDAYHQVGVEYEAALAGLDTSNLENWTETEYTQAHAAVDAAIASVNGLQPPPIAVDLQAKAVESLQLFKELLTAIQADGIFAAFPFMDRIDTASAELDAIALPIEEHCQIAILDNDDDGEPEIGAGAQISPEVDPSAPLGDYANPYPIGTAQPTVDGWTIQVDSVTPDGTQQVLDENSFNEAPEAGRQFFIATITATYTGPGAETFDGNFRLRLRSANNAIYTAFGDACGVTPNEWDEDVAVASGQSITGNLCWSVPTEELSYLRMFDKEAEDGGNLVYWSLGQEPL